MKKILTVAIVSALICSVLASYFICASIAEMLTPSFFVSKIVVMSKPMPPGTYQASIIGDAYGMYSFLELFHQFSADRFTWSSSLPTYPPGTFINMGIDVRSLDFEPVNAWTYHLSVRELNQGYIKQNEIVAFSVQCRSGELDFAFSNSYHTLDITGTLKGNVDFQVGSTIAPELQFTYAGSELAIDLHISPT